MLADFDPDPQALKRRFKQRCVETGGVYRNWQIRVHRSLSWSLRAKTFGEAHPEAELLYLWIALNSLYGEWDAAECRPAHDGSSRRRFLRRLVRADASRCAQFLRERKPVLKKLLSSPFLSSTFWRNPDAPSAREHAIAELYQLDRLLRHGPHDRLLELAFDRVAVFRGQLVHGASSGGSRLNRGTLAACLEWLRGAVPLTQHLAIEHLADDDWPAMCYPPLEG
ncbi:MAG: hypothetical protein ACK4PI_01190 [Tepidisphaerales bacterium]